MGLSRGNGALPRKTTGTCGFLQLGAGRIDKIKHRFKMPFGLAKRVAGNYNALAAMSFAPVIKGKFNFGPLLKKPFGQQADSLGTPMNLILN